MAVRRGKIARLPYAIREELNLRLLDNQTSRVIMAWLNALPETIQMRDELGKTPINKSNLHQWRYGGFAEWLRRRDRVAETREMAQWSMKLAQAGGENISEGASAILAGKILEVLEGLTAVKKDFAEDSPEARAEHFAQMTESINTLSRALGTVRQGDQNKQKLALAKKVIKQKDETIALDREKFERLVCGHLLDPAKRKKAEKIASSNLSYEEKISAIRAVAFADVDALEKSGEVVIPD